MKHLIFSVAFLCFSIMSFCADKDSLVLVTQRLHEAFNLKDDGLYKISVDRKFIGDTDTSQNISVVKFYPSLSGSKLDAIKNHFHHHTDMDYGTLYNQGQLVVANYEKKRVWTIEDYTQKMLRKVQGGFFIYPAQFTTYNYNETLLLDYDSAAYYITDDSLWFKGNMIIDDDITGTTQIINTIEISYHPRLHIKIKEERLCNDDIMSQMFFYDIIEIDGYSTLFFPKELNQDYLSLFPGFSLTDRPPRSDDKQTKPINEGDSSVPWKGVLSSNKQINSSQVNQRFVILDFWYKSCGPCLLSIPVLSEFYDKLSDRDVEMFGVNPVDKDVKEDANNVFELRGGNYPIIYDDDRSMMEDFGVYSFPCVIIIDQFTNKIIFRHHGHSLDLVDKMKEAIKMVRGF